MHYYEPLKRALKTKVVSFITTDTKQEAKTWRSFFLNIRTNWARKTSKVFTILSSKKGKRTQFFGVQLLETSFICIFFHGTPRGCPSAARQALTRAFGCRKTSHHTGFWVRSPLSPAPHVLFSFRFGGLITLFHCSIPVQGLQDNITLEKL